MSPPCPRPFGDLFIYEYILFINGIFAICCSAFLHAYEHTIRMDVSCRGPVVPALKSQDENMWGLTRVLSAILLFCAVFLIVGEEGRSGGQIAKVPR